jgi:hypothetical protein
MSKRNNCMHIEEKQQAAHWRKIVKQVLKDEYFSLGSISTLKKGIIIILKNGIRFFNLKLYIFPSSIIILWYE